MANLSTKKKFIFYAILPLIAIIVLSINSTIESKKTYSNLILLDDMVQTSIYISNLVHELQKERGLSLGYLSSSGLKFSNSMKDQIKQTNNKKDTVKKEIAIYLINANRTEKVRYSAINYEFANFQLLREQVRLFQVSSKATLLAYSKLITLLLDVIGIAEKPLVNNKINKYVYSYYTFLLAKEQVGLERALITQVIEKQQNDRITYSDVISLRTLQKSFLHLSLENSTKHLRKKFKKIIEANKMARFENLDDQIFSSNKVVNITIDSETWFKEITKKIDLLQEAEDLYISMLKKEMQIVKNATIKKIVVKVIVIFIIVLFFLFFTRVRVKNLTEYFNTSMENLNRSNEEKIKNYEEVILSFVDIIDQRDSYTAGHTKRVSTYCKLIAKQMGLSPAEISRLGKAALLHDIGKIQTPDSVLLKPSKLTELEYKLIQEHSITGYKILNEMEIYRDLAVIIKEHHERFDGNGYPDGLKGNEIGNLSRILIVADAFDAMTTNRIYKPRLSKDDAINELIKLKSIQFHPEVVDMAIIALENVVIEDNIHQKPLTRIEKERFSYFYKDQLTNCYNYDYFNLKTIENEETTEYLSVTSITLKKFSSYNSKFSWNEGNVVLQNIGSYLIKRFPEDLVFRIEGDDFKIMHQLNIVDLSIGDLSIELEHIADNDILEFLVTHKKIPCDKRT